MAPDPSGLVGSIAKSVEVEDVPMKRRVEASDEIRRARIRQDHERRRREMERKLKKMESFDDESQEESGGLDVVV